MTARQLQFITTLAAEKDLSGLSDVQREYLNDVLAGTHEPTPAHASRVIDALLALPSLQPTSPSANAPAVEVEAGRYALVADDGAVKFYTVDRPTEGRWAGRTFLNAMGSDTRYPVRDRNERNRILGLIAQAPQQAMRLYASELGRCGYCGRELTDEVSRAAGIGPDCASRHGIDRSVWADAAMAEAAARVRGDAPARPSVPADGVEEDIYWGNLFAQREREQERAAYAAEMAMERAAENRDQQQRRSDPSAAMGWRERRAAVATQQGHVSRRPAKCSQLTELPGETWEDIFGMGAGA